LAHGTAKDTLNLAQMVKTVMNIEPVTQQATSKSVSILRGLRKGVRSLGFALGIGNVVMDAFEVHEDENDIRRAASITNMVFDSVGVTIEA
jgi:hypothetical protein